VTCRPRVEGTTHNAQDWDAHDWDAQDWDAQDWDAHGSRTGAQVVRVVFSRSLSLEPADSDQITRGWANKNRLGQKKNVHVGSIQYHGASGRSWLHSVLSSAASSSISCGVVLESSLHVTLRIVNTEYAVKRYSSSPDTKVCLT